MNIFIKTLISCFLPIPLCLALNLIGLILLWSKQRQRLGRTFITFGFLILLIFSWCPLPNLLIHQLEKRYPALSEDRLAQDTLSEIKYVVVLAGGHIMDSRLPVTSQFTYSGLVRLIEGIRLYKKILGAKLILSGGAGDDPVTDADLMANLCAELGVLKEEIILEPRSRNTYEEARLVKPIVQDGRFILVTSASHMPRAMALFKKQGINRWPRRRANSTNSIVKNIP